MNYRAGQRPDRRLRGATIAGMTALTSGVSVFMNGYGVRAVPDASVYTTAKNLVAAIVLGIAILAVPPLRAAMSEGHRRSEGVALSRDAVQGGTAKRLWQGLGVAYVGIAGGGLAFVLFFSGLARSSAEPASFLHDTLVIWVALLAWPLLGERLSRWNLAAIGLLVVGQVLVVGGVGHLVESSGEVLVLSATLLWAVEVVVIKRLLSSHSAGSVALVRMGGGSVTLLGYLTATGHLGALVGLDARQLSWIVLTGVLLALYVGTWLAALARARVLDVTSILVGSVVVTSILQELAGRGVVASGYLGLSLIVAGAALVLARWPRRVIA